MRVVQPASEFDVAATSDAAAGNEMPAARAPRTRRPVRDAVLAAAVDLARGTAEEMAADSPFPGDKVGEHLGVTVEGERLVSHEFACLLPGYSGWRWIVVLGRAPRQRHATVVETALLPGPEALQPPEWLPWSERLRPGDLGPGDVLPAEPGDPRLAPGWTGGAAIDLSDDDAAELWELGLGRVRVLSPEGRGEAADRWYAGDAGPLSPVAQAAPGRCSTCGFMTLLAGSLRQAFGVCANVYSPRDGAIVALDYGCGAHSEAALAPAPVPPAPPVLDELGVDEVVREPLAHPEGSVAVAAPDEDLGHS